MAAPPRDYYSSFLLPPHREMNTAKQALLLGLLLASGIGWAVSADRRPILPTPPASAAAASAAARADSSPSPSPSPSPSTSTLLPAPAADEAFGADPDVSVRAAAMPRDDATQTALARGAHLAALGDCMVCHTAKDGAPYAGGRPLKTPFGTIYATNITPDAATGIGGWSADDFVRAMRRGISRDGHRLYPAFPYVHFTHLSDTDLDALYRFMMQRDPVHAIAPRNQLMFPLNFRPLLAGWDTLFLRDVGVTPQGAPSAPAQDAEWERGRYLVESVGHCAACHTPMNVLGAEKSGQAFKGGVVEGWWAPSLTQLANRPIPWTQTQLVAYLRTGLASEHGAAAGPMLAVTAQLARVPPADVEAIAHYVMRLQAPAGDAPGESVSTPPTGGGVPADQLPGARLFTGSCAACHGAGAPMSTQTDRPPLSLSTAVDAADPRNVVQQILQGIPLEGSGAECYMPAFGTLLSDEQIAEVANYTRAAYSKHGPWLSLDAAAVAKLRKQGVPP